MRGARRRGVRTRNGAVRPGGASGRTWIAALAAAVLLAAPRTVAAAAPGVPRASAQEDRADAEQVERSIDRYRDYLARKPYHEWAFDKLVEAAVSRNLLADLVAEYAARVAESSETPQGAAPGDQADQIGARVVLARLQARADRLPDALATLEAIEERDAPLWKLMGELLLKNNQPTEAALALGRAVELLGPDSDRELASAVYKARAEALLAGGERDAAADALRALAELEPEGFHTRLEVAGELARHGLDEAASEQFAVARELAGDDTAKRCRVLAEIGRLHERRMRGDEALAVYAEAIALMARGNWLKEELRGRVLALHKRAGSLDDLIETQRAAVEAASGDLEAREFLAAVYREAGRPNDARGVLRAATKDFPDDLRLSRALMRSFEEDGDDQALIAEYQRAIESHPEEIDLYLELGEVFARGGMSEQARLQWQRSLESRVSDAGLAVRLAEAYARYELEDDALALYEKAIELEPREVRHYGDLAQYLTRLERTEAVPEVLERAATAASETGDPGMIEAVGYLWRENGEPARALALLERALATKDDDARLFTAVADLLVELGRIDEAAERLHGAIELSNDVQARSATVDRVIRLFRKNDRLDDLVAREKAAIDAGDAALAPYLILGRVQVQERRSAAAVELYEALLAKRPEQEDARVQLARLFEEQGDFGRALAEYEALTNEHPRQRRKYLKHMARIHLTLFDQDAAFACYDEILRSAPDNAAAFQEVAEAYSRLNLFDKAIENLRQAVRLKPEDGEMRLDLAKAYRTLGQPERARVEILEAARADDEDVRDKAHEAYYALLREEGLIDDEIDSLRARVEDNPYDVEASLLLADLYVRELEFELALATMERLLTYQPREPRLLSERARVLGKMERHEEAIADLETLWKLPDADREDLALRIGEAAILAGDLDRAKLAIAPVRDVERVAKLYRRHDLFDEAAAALEAGIAAAPEDGKLYRQLAAVLSRTGDKRGAADAYERVLAIEGDSLRTMGWLGDIYHEIGERGLAIECGRRMFALIRLPEDELGEKDEDEDPYALNVSMTATDQYSQGLSQVQNYFTSKGYLDEFGTIAEDELDLQPSNYVLFTRVLSHFQNTKKDVGRAADIVARVRTATLDSGLVPPSYTTEAWRDLLDARRVGIYSGDHAVAKTRAEELAKTEAAGDAVEATFVELAQLYELLRRDDDARAVFERGLALHPGSERLLSGYALRLENAEAYAAAAEAYGRLVDALRAEESSGARSAEDAERRELAFRAARRQLFEEFPFPVRRDLDEVDLRRLYDIATPAYWAFSAGLGGRSTWQGAAVRRAGVLVKLDRRDEARAVLAALTPPPPPAGAATPPADVAAVARVAHELFSLELFDESRELGERALAIEAELGRDPLLSLVTSWRNVLVSAVRDLGRIHERQGRTLEAYELIRTYEGPRPAELLLTTSGRFAEAEAKYAERYQAALAAHEAASDPATRFALRDAGIRYAEILQFQKKWDAALAIYSAVAEALPDELDVREVIAALHERAGDHEAAIAAHFDIIDKKRRANRTFLTKAEPRRREITPEAPQRANGGENDWIWQNLSYSWRYSSGSGSQQLPLTSNYAAILRICLDRGQVAKAADVMIDLAREDIATFGWMSWSIAQLIENYQLGAKGEPILRLLYAHSPEDEDTAHSFGRALIASGKLDEAERVLTRLINRPGVQSYYKDRAREELERVRTKLGLAKSETLLDLAAAVDADPKSVKARTKLARRALEKGEYALAREAADAARGLAPHLDDVEALVLDCCYAQGDYTAVRAVLAERVERMPEGDERFATAVELANSLWADGEAEAVEPLLRRARDTGSGASNYSPASWFIERGLYEDAARLLAGELEQRSTRDSYGDAIRRRLAKLDLLMGDVAGVVDAGLERFGEASGYADQAARFGETVDVLHLSPDPDRLLAEVAEIADRRGGRERLVLLAAVAMSVGDVAAAAERFAELMDAYPEDVWPFPILVGIDRVQGNLEGALARMRAIDERGLVSMTANVSTTIGYVTERDALRAEMGTLLLSLGREDEARATWESILDPQEARSRRTLATLYQENEFYDEALAHMREYLEKVGERNTGDLQFLADLELRAGDTDAALAAYERALVLAADDENTRQSLRGRILDVHRRAHSLPAYRDDLAARSAADPNDVELLLVLASVEDELGNDDGARAALERVAERPGQEAAALTRLAELYREQGRHEESVGALQRLLDGNLDEWERRNRASELARTLFALGRDEEARKALARATDDPESKEARSNEAEALLAAGRKEAAVDVLLELLAEDPDADDLRLRTANVLMELERFREARAQLVLYLRSGKGALATGRLVDTGRTIEAGLRDAPLPEAADDDADALFELGLVAWWRGDREHARAALERMLALDSDDISGLSAAYHLALEMGEDRSAHELGLRYRDRCEREVLAGRADEWEMRQIVQELGEIELRLGIVDEALATWRGPYMRRSRNVRSYRYSYYNDPQVNLVDLARMLKEHGLVTEALQAMEESALLLERSFNSGRDYEELLFQSGERERAIELLWRRIVDPTAGLTQRSMTGNVYYFTDDSGGGSWVNAPLLAMYREEGREDELVARVEAALERYPDHADLKALRGYLSVQREDWDAVLAAIDAELADNPFDVNVLERKVGALTELGRFAEAVPIQVEVERMRRGQTGGYREFTLGGAQGGVSLISGVRFQWAGAQSRSSGVSSFYSTSWAQTGSEERRTLAALEAAAGDRDSALALEERELASAVLDPGSAHLSLARAYARVGLFADVERHARAAIAADAEKHERNALEMLFDQSVGEDGRAEDAARVGAELLALLDEKIAEHPEGRALLYARGRVRLRLGSDPAAAAADLEAALEREPYDVSSAIALAEARLGAGDAEGALTTCAYAERTARERGMMSRLGGDHFLTCGFAKAALGRLDEARADLLRGLAVDPRNRRAAEARAVLQ